MNNKDLIHPRRIGFDIDGVVADTAGSFLRILATEHGIDAFALDDITDFTVEECLDIDAAIVNAIFHRLHVDPVGAMLAPMPGAVATLRELASHAPLAFITARSHMEPIAAWLAGTLGEDVMATARLVVTGDHDNKAGHIRHLELDCFVDDRAQTCLQLFACGINSIVFSQPWNRGRHNLPVVETWQDIRARCLGPTGSTGSDDALSLL